jgi:hypothetical protein
MSFMLQNCHHAMQYQITGSGALEQVLLQVSDGVENRRHQQSAEGHAGEDDGGRLR